MALASFPIPSMAQSMPWAAGMGAFQNALRQGQQISQSQQSFPYQLKQQELQAKLANILGPEKIARAQLANRMLGEQVALFPQTARAKMASQIAQAQYLTSPGLSQKYLSPLGKAHTEAQVIPQVLDQIRYQQQHPTPHFSAALNHVMSGEPAMGGVASQQASVPKTLEDFKPGQKSALADQYIPRQVPQSVIDQPTAPQVGSQPSGSPVPGQAQEQAPGSVPGAPSVEPGVQEVKLPPVQNADGSVNLVRPNQSLQEALGNDYLAQKVRLLVPPKMIQRFNFARNMERTLQAINPKDLGVYSGLGGKIRFMEDRLALARNGELPDRMKKWIIASNNVTQLENHVRQFTGGSVREEEMKRIKSMFYPQGWWTSPKIVEENFKAGRRNLRREAESMRQFMIDAGRGYKTPILTEEQRKAQLINKNQKEKIEKPAEKKNSPDIGQLKQMTSDKLLDLIRKERGIR